MYTFREQKMKVDGITCDRPIGSVPKKELWTETIEVWDYLVESNYGPSDFFCGEIKMNYQGFKRLVEENGKCARTKETRHYRISAVWIGNVEVSFTEVKIDKDDWLLEQKWSPLE
jgi:hypothetical protein